jgi:ferredoxin
MAEMKYLKGVSTLELNREACTGCGMCTAVCPHGVLVVEERNARIEDRDRCMECGACARNCPAAALSVKAGVGCASAIIHAWLTGGEPSCDCGGGDSCC